MYTYTLIVVVIIIIIVNVIANDILEVEVPYEIYIKHCTIVARFSEQSLNIPPRTQQPGICGIL